MASGNLFVEARRLYDVPAKYKATPLSLSFEMSNYEGGTALAMPKIKAVNGKNSICAEWPNSWEFELDDPEDFHDNIIDFEIKDSDGHVLARASLATNKIQKTKPYEEDILVKPHANSDFEGAKLQVAITYQSPPPIWPEHLHIRIEEGYGFYIANNQLADESSAIYISISHNERILGATRALPGPHPKWMDYIVEPHYEQEPWILLTAFAKHLGEEVLIGSCRVNIWNVLDKATAAEYEWIKHGEVHLSIDGKHSEAPRGIIKMTVRFSNDPPPSAVSIPNADTLSSPAAGDPQHIVRSSTSSSSSSSQNSADQHLNPVIAKDKAKEARRLADEAEEAARAADHAAADADLVARMNPDREINALANDADEAAKKARDAADKANNLAIEAEDLAKKPKIRADVMYKLVEGVKNNLHDALDDRDRAEEDAKLAFRCNADDLAAKAKDHYTKTSDYTTQTEKLADEHDQVPKIRSLAYASKEDQSSAMLAAQDARSEAKACRDAKNLASAYKAMKECEAMVREAKRCEIDAQDKWKKAHKLAQKRKKEMEAEQEKELQKRQEEAAAEALKKEQERLQNHKQDKNLRQNGQYNEGENDAYQLSLMNMANDAKPPPRYNRGGVFRNCCMEPPRMNPAIRATKHHGTESECMSEGYVHKLPQVKLSELVVHQQPDILVDDHPHTTMAKLGAEPNGGQLDHSDLVVEKRRLKTNSNTRDYNSTTYELVETQYEYKARQKPWCWCFGCQCCHCCGEC